jgi:hypothetical protein
VVGISGLQAGEGVNKADLEQIHCLAIKLYVDLNPKVLKMDDAEFRTYCYVQATQAWLRMRGLLKIILD